MHIKQKSDFLKKYILTILVDFNISFFFVATRIRPNETDPEPKHRTQLKKAIPSQFPLANASFLLANGSREEGGKDEITGISNLKI